MKVGRYILIVLLLVSTSSFAQEKIVSIQQRIGGHLERMASFEKNAQKDSLLVENKNLATYLESVLSKEPALMNADMAALASSGFNVLLSDDGKLKIYQWRTALKDTIGSSAGHPATYVDKFHAVAAFKTESAVGSTVIQEKTEQEMRYDSLFSVKGKEHTYYLLVSTGIDKLGNKVMKMQACYIDGTALSNNANIFSSSGSSVSNISIVYSRNSPTPGKMQISIDKQAISVLSPGNIKRSLVYKFDGHTFVLQKAP